MELVLELADSSPEPADSSTDFMIISRQPEFNMFDIWNQLDRLMRIGRLLPLADGKSGKWIRA